MSKAKPTVRAITLQAYEKLTKGEISAPLFVINSTGKNNRPRGCILINVMDEGGRSSCIEVVDTFIPVDLTQYATRKNLLESTDFRTHLSKRSLMICDPNSVHEYMSASNRARQEYRSITGQDYDIDMFVDLDNLADNTDHSEMDTNVPTQNDSVYPHAEEVISLLTSGDDVRALDLLNSRGLSMSIEELKYLEANVSSNAVKELIVEILEELEEE